LFWFQLIIYLCGIKTKLQFEKQLWELGVNHKVGCQFWIEFNKYKAKVKAKDGAVVECQKSKKWKGVPLSSIIDFFGGGTSYPKKYST